MSSTPEEEIVKIASRLSLQSSKESSNNSKAYLLCNDLNRCFLRAKSYEHCGSLSEAAIAGRQSIINFILDLVASGEPPSVVALTTLHFMAASSRVRKILIDSGFLALLFGILIGAANSIFSFRAASEAFRITLSSLKYDVASHFSLKSVESKKLGDESSIAIQAATNAAVSAQANTKFQIANQPLSSSLTPELYVSGLSLLSILLNSPLPKFSTKSENHDTRDSLSGKSTVLEDKGATEASSVSHPTAPFRAESSPVNNSISNSGRSKVINREKKETASLYTMYGANVVRVATRWLWSDEAFCRKEALCLLENAIYSKKGIKAVYADEEVMRAIMFSEAIETHDTDTRHKARSIRFVLPTLRCLLLERSETE